MSLFIDGKLQKGAGSAGALGRMVVEPAGEFNSTFAARGPLEVYAARPWLSRHMVAEYLAETDKRTSSDEAADTTFRKQLQTAAKRGLFDSISLLSIAAGLSEQDHIAVALLDDAARYLGMAINAVITIVNPPLIILGGEMIQALPAFGQSAMAYARRLSWGAAWNRTTIHISTLGNSAQTQGAAILTDELSLSQASN
jgi:glucokinase